MAYLGWRNSWPAIWMPSRGWRAVAAPENSSSGKKAEVYQRLAEVNRQIRQERQKLAICREIQKEAPQMERSIQYTMEPEEVRHDERRRR